MKPNEILLPVLLFCLNLDAATVTFNGAVTNQVIDGFGVNANRRSWNNDELKPVLDAFIDQAGMTLFRVVHDLSDWEASNDNADSTVMNWAYYNSIYSSTNFTQLWDMFAYLNSRGITNGAFFNFMGWGPAWMVNSSTHYLNPGMEEEWAEMIASLLVYARNTRGLQFSLVGPDNEPELYAEGIRMEVTTYTNALHQLALKLDTNGLSNLRFVAPDCSQGGTTYMPQLIADPVIMAKLKHFGIHNYGDGGSGSAGVLSFILGSPYPDRTFWMTEFNVLCSGCDAGTRGTYDWTYCRGTADYLLHDLLNGASAGLVWEGYDSIYAHGSYKWSFWGVFAVDDTNAPVKTYTPRKNFYTLAQISKWVRPGAQRIGMSGSTSPFTPLLAFKHSALSQVTVVGINTSSSAAVLNGTLASLPAVQQLDLYYTSASTNLAYGGSVTVSNGTFSKTIPADCVFTLTGFAGVTLTNGISCTNSNSGVGQIEDHYRYTVTDPVARVQFEILEPTADLTLVARKGLPMPGLGLFDYLSANPGTNDEFILVLTNSLPVPVAAGDWYLTVVNPSGVPANYTIKATQSAESGQPIILNAAGPQDNSFCFSWNSLPDAHYVVQGKAWLTDSNWVDVSGTITASNAITSYCVPLPSPYHFFCVHEGAALYATAPSDQPITLVVSGVQSDSFCFSWNSLSNAHYVVQAKAWLTDSNWGDVSGTITATNAMTRQCVTLPSPYHFFRVLKSVSQ